MPEMLRSSASPLRPDRKRAVARLVLGPRDTPELGRRLESGGIVSRLEQRPPRVKAPAPRFGPARMRADECTSRKRVQRCWRARRSSQKPRTRSAIGVSGTAARNASIACSSCRPNLRRNSRYRSQGCSGWSRSASVRRSKRACSPRRSAVRASRTMMRSMAARATGGPAESARASVSLVPGRNAPRRRTIAVPGPRASRRRSRLHGPAARPVDRPPSIRPPPEGGAPVRRRETTGEDGGRDERLFGLMARLRQDCPWDRVRRSRPSRRARSKKRTRLPTRSRAEDFDALRDELGDLLFQVAFHAIWPTRGDISTSRTSSNRSWTR